MIFPDECVVTLNKVTTQSSRVLLKWAYDVIKMNFFRYKLKIYYSYWIKILTIWISYTYV